MVTEDNASSPMPTDDPDAGLMLDFQRGEKIAFGKLLVKYYPRLLNFIYRFTSDREWAEDIAQEVFIKVYDNAARYRPLAKFSTWLFTIARNVTLNELRKRGQMTVSLDQTHGPGGQGAQWQVEDHKARADKEVLAEEQVLAVRRAVLTLPENQRTAVLLRRYEGQSYEEIAATMGISVAAVKSLLNRAKENLKAKLAYLIEPPGSFPVGDSP